MDMDDHKTTISGAMSIQQVHQTAKLRGKVGEEAWDEVVAVSNDMGNEEIVLAMDMVDETDFSNMVRVAG